MLPIKEPEPGREMTPPPQAPARASRRAPLGERLQPVSPFVVFRLPEGVRARHHPSAPEERNATASPRYRPAPAGFYSSHTPPLRGFKHPSVSARAPGTFPVPAEVPALAMASARPITLVAGVTRRSCRRTSDTSASAQSPCSGWSTLSRGRNQKLPSTHRRQAFPVRHRLRSNSPASP